MDSHQIQFILKSMLGLTLVSFMIMSSLISPAFSSPIQNQEEPFRPMKNPPSAIVQNNQPTFQTKDSSQNKESRQDEAFKTYNPNFIVNYQQLTRNGAEIVNVRPTRRTILSTLMAPFMQMRDQAMNMFSASIQGCNGGNQTLWCRLMGMFFK